MKEAVETVFNIRMYIEIVRLNYLSFRKINNRRHRIFALTVEIVVILIHNSETIYLLSYFISYEEWILIIIKYSTLQCWITTRQTFDKFWPYTAVIWTPEISKCFIIPYFMYFMKHWGWCIIYKSHIIWVNVNRAKQQQPWAYTLLARVVPLVVKLIWCFG